MIYPNGFEEKIGFSDVRSHLKEHCLSTLGKEEVDKLSFMTDASAINEQLSRVRELRRMNSTEETLPLQHFFDVRSAVDSFNSKTVWLSDGEGGWFKAYPLVAAYVRKIRGNVILKIDRAVWKTFARESRHYTEYDIMQALQFRSPLTMRLYEIANTLTGPGEFTRRAFLNGRVDLSRAEAVSVERVVFLNEIHECGQFLHEPDMERGRHKRLANNALLA